MEQRTERRKTYDCIRKLCAHALPYALPSAQLSIAPAAHSSTVCSCDRSVLESGSIAASSALISFALPEERAICRSRCMVAFQLIVCCC